MSDIRPGKDVQTLSAFRANAAGMIDHVRQSGRPLILTQNGRSAAVLLDVEQYDALMDQLELVREVREARAERERGETISHEAAMAQLRSRVRE